MFIDSTSQLPCLIWADDIVILSETKAGLQSQLNFLSAYSETNILPVNVDKTKYACYNKQERLIRSNLHYNNAILEDVNEFMYLGFLVRSNGNVIAGLKNLVERASKAYYNLRNVLGPCMFRDVITAFKLFDSLIKPILLYASDFGGFSKINTKGNIPVDKFQTKFYKWILGVSKKTSNMGTFSELDRFPISFKGQTRLFENFIRIIGKKNCNKLVLQNYKY